MDKNKYQIMPSLSQAEFNTLKSDIELRGIQVPVELDEEGNILDGFHRVKICKELGKEYPTVIRLNMTEEAKHIHIRSLNLARRHLTSAQKREIVKQQLKETPGVSDNQIAQMLGISQPTVSSIRKEMEKSGELIKFISSIGADGKERPREIEHKQSVGITASSGKEAEAVLDTLKVLEEESPDLFSKVVSGEKTVESAKRDHNKQKAEEEDIAKFKVDAPAEARIVLGDSIALLDKIQNQSFDCLFTDPLYITDIEDFEKFTASWIDKAFTKLKPTSKAFIFSSSNPQEIAIYIEKLSNIDRFSLGNILIWHYQNTIGPVPKYAFKKSWQAIFYLYGKDTLPIDSPLMTEQFDVLVYPTPDARNQVKYHKYQKPEGLIRHLLAYSTKEGDRVLDLFAGSGSIGIAAAKLNRPSLSIEIEIENFENAIKRGAVKYDL